MQNGQRVVRRISDAHLGLDTDKTYDPLGRLSYERVELQTPNPNQSGSDRYEERFYDHGAEGRIIFKDSRLRLSSSGPDTEHYPLPIPSTGQQTYVYAGERMAATVGAQRLAGGTKFDFAYTPMSEAAGSGASRYVVQSGNSLIDIAQASYGDGALWYAIADANGRTDEPGDPLPTTEVGKAYEIPAVVRSSHSASTFKPYEMAEIIGNDRPIAVPPPPPPKYSDMELMAVAAASITIQVGATIGLSALGVPVPISVGIGAGLGNLAGQATSWGLGMQAPGQHGIDWDGVGMAAFEGFVFSVAGSSAGPVVGGLGREVLAAGQGRLRGLDERPRPELERDRRLIVHCRLRRAGTRARRAGVRPGTGWSAAVQLQPSWICQQRLQPKLGLGDPGQRTQPDRRRIRIRLQRGDERTGHHGLQLDPQAGAQSGG